MKILLSVINIMVLLFSGCSSIGQQEIPQKIIKITDEYIISKTGEEFFRNYFSVDYKNSVIDSPKVHIAYKFHINEKPFVDEKILITTDIHGNIDRKNNISGIPDCLKDSALCSFIINEEDVIRIAEENGLEKGMKNWKKDFTWDNIYEKYVWIVNSVISESEGSNGYRGNGWQVIIDPGTGEVIDKKEWFVR